MKVSGDLTEGKVFEKLDELKIVDAYISKVSHSKLEEFKKEVRVMAIKAAKEKANYLLTANWRADRTMKILEATKKPSAAMLVHGPADSPGTRCVFAKINTEPDASCAVML